MTTTAELSQDEKRSLIAKECGKIWHSDSQHIGIQKTATLHGRGIEGMPMAWEQCECGASRYNGSRIWEFSSSKYEEAPDYLNSLDAMHEAEKTLIGGESLLAEPRARKIGTLPPLTVAAISARIHGMLQRDRDMRGTIFFR